MLADPPRVVAQAFDHSCEAGRDGGGSGAFGVEAEDRDFHRRDATGRSATTVEA